MSAKPIVLFVKHAEILIAQIEIERLERNSITELMLELRAELAKSGNCSLLLDFSNVSALTEDALTPLVLLHAELGSRYRAMVLCNLSAAMNQLLSSRNLDRPLLIGASETEAFELVTANAERPPSAATTVRGHYMKLVPGHHGALDRIGGLPTHLPPQFPMTQKGNVPIKTKRRRVAKAVVEMIPMAFSGQFYCHPERLHLPGALCLQIYQADPGDDPEPAVVVVPLGAAMNIEGQGRVNQDAVLHDVEWETREDPASCPVNVFDPICRTLMESKVGGTTFFHNSIAANESFILQMRDDRLGSSHGVNFGGFTLLVVADVMGAVSARLA